MGSGGTEAWEGRLPIVNYVPDPNPLPLGDWRSVSCGPGTTQSRILKEALFIVIFTYSHYLNIFTIL